MVERFLPEGREGNYYHRRYLFFGDAEWNEVWSGTESINFADNAQLRTSVESPPDEVRQWRSAAKADYGKLDYVIHNDRVEVFDVNRTPSGSLLDKDPRDARWAQEVTDALAMGIHTYLS